MTDLKKELRQLATLCTPPGSEQEAADWVRSQLAGLEPTTDRTGQLAYRFGPAGEVRLMVSAHLDEVGLVVSRIEADGYVRLLRIGGIPERVLPGLRVRFLGRHGAVCGVIGLKAHHLTQAHEKYVAKPTEELYADLGLTTAEEVRASGVEVGTRVTYEPSWTELGDDRVATKGLDNRLGVVALVELAKRLRERPLDQGVVIAFTTQEEFHVRGTLALTARFRPAALVNLDVSPATDTPDTGEYCSVRLGGGPVLNLLSFHGRGTLGGLIPDQNLVTLVEHAAEQAGVPLQRETIIGLITDAAFVPMSTPEGVACVGLGIPCRYTHSPIEVGSIRDLEQTISLLEVLVHHVLATNA